MRLFGLIGKPLGHSFSSSYFGDKFKRLAINAEYHNYPLENLEDINDLIRNEDRLEGLNVTLPYKEDILAFLDYIDPLAKAIGAVNVIKLRRIDNRIQLFGYNTDILGFKASLSSRLVTGIKKALVLGTGGAALAVIHGLMDMGIEYSMVSRNPKEDMLGYKDLGAEIFKEYKLIINTTPLGMYPDLEFAPEIPYNQLTENNILYDLVYNPTETLFMKKGKERACITIGGLEMLHMQAEEAWRIWNDNSIG